MLGEGYVFHPAAPGFFNSCFYGYACGAICIFRVAMVIKTFDSVFHFFIVRNLQKDESLSIKAFYLPFVKIGSLPRADIKHGRRESERYS